MRGNLSNLSNKSLVLIFAYAPAGLGHLRVTDALYHGLPKGVSPLLLGSQDKTITYLHRLTSVHPAARYIMEKTQRGALENIFTFCYAFFLRSRAKLIYQQMITVLDQRIDIPETVLVVATHFGLAHQLAAVKARIQKERNIKLTLIVQVTDDSPQWLWYVPGADLILVPSEKTKKELVNHGRRVGLPEVRFEVSPYPVSPLLVERLSPNEFQTRIRQVDVDGKSDIHMMIPVSGAAVGTDFFTTLIDSLYGHSKRFIFHVVSKSSLYTQFFLNQMLERPRVELAISTHDRGVLDKYEEVYNRVSISLEITKPSEQSFKALLSPNHKGGSILLFSHPVGRQEYDNLNFLERHYLIPHARHQELLWQKAKSNESLDKKDKEIFDRMSSWRGLRLPHGAHEAGNFIWWAMREGIFTKMFRWHQDTEMMSANSEELGWDGVSKFWKKVVEFLEETSQK